MAHIFAVNPVMLNEGIFLLHLCCFLRDCNYTANCVHKTVFTVRQGKIKLNVSFE